MFKQAKLATLLGMALVFVTSTAYVVVCPASLLFGRPRWTAYVRRHAVQAQDNRGNGLYRTQRPSVQRGADNRLS